MAESALNITDDQLMDELQNSFIDTNQKKELATLIPHMTADERGELLGIIKQSHEEAEKAGLTNQDKLKQLNEEYEKKLNKLVKESNEDALKDFEETAGKTEAGELKAIECEIVALDSNTLKQASKSDLRKKKSYGLRNVFIILFILSLIAGGVLYALNYLSNIQA